VYSINLASKEYNIMKARNLRQALKLLDKQEFAVVATDLFLGEEDAGGFDILLEVHKKRPYTQVIIFTGLGGKMDGLV
jgi:DNA-binding NtrC family response regulator